MSGILLVEMNNELKPNSNVKIMAQGNACLSACCSSHPGPYLLEVKMPRPKGYKHSEQTKEKIRIGNIGNKNAVGFRNALGYRHTEESKRKMRENHYDQSGERGNNWKGNKAGYFALHIRVRGQRGKPCFCEVCKTIDKNKTYEWSNLTGNFVNIMDYKRMCKSCHNKYDKNKEVYG